MPILLLSAVGPEFNVKSRIFMNLKLPYVLVDDLVCATEITDFTVNHCIVNYCKIITCPGHISSWNQKKTRRYLFNYVLK